MPIGAFGTGPFLRTPSSPFAARGLTAQPGWRPTFTTPGPGRCSASTPCLNFGNTPAAKRRSPTSRTSSTAPCADFHRRYPAYRTLLLLFVPKDGTRDILAEIARAGDAGFNYFCPGLTPSDRALTAEEVAAVRAAGMGFRVFGVNRPEDLRRARDAGAEAFTCNYWHQAFDWAKDVGGIELLR